MVIVIRDGRQISGFLEMKGEEGEVDWDRASGTFWGDKMSYFHYGGGCICV